MSRWLSEGQKVGSLFDHSRRALDLHLLRMVYPPHAMRNINCYQDIHNPSVRELLAQLTFAEGFVR
jgi:hypothetical protein